MGDINEIGQKLDRGAMLTNEEGQALRGMVHVLAQEAEALRRAVLNVINYAREEMGDEDLVCVVALCAGYNLATEEWE